MQVSCLDPKKHEEWMRSKRGEEVFKDAKNGDLPRNSGAEEGLCGLWMGGHQVDGWVSEHLVTYAGAA